MREFEQPMPDFNRTGLSDATRKSSKSLRDPFQDRDPQRFASETTRSAPCIEARYGQTFATAFDKSGVLRTCSPGQGLRVSSQFGKPPQESFATSPVKSQLPDRPNFEKFDPGRDEALPELSQHFSYVHTNNLKLTQSVPNLRDWSNPWHAPLDNPQKTSYYLKPQPNMKVDQKAVAAGLPMDNREP